MKDAPSDQKQPQSVDTGQLLHILVQQVAMLQGQCSRIADALEAGVVARHFDKSAVKHTCNRYIEENGQREKAIAQHQQQQAVAEAKQKAKLAKAAREAAAKEQK